MHPEDFRLLELVGEASLELAKRGFHLHNLQMNDEIREKLYEVLEFLQTTLTEIEYMAFAPPSPLEE